MVGHGRPGITVGRQDELEIIAGATQAALTGTPRVVLVAGEAGIGKSRLVTESLRDAGEKGLVAVSGTCLALGTQIPYLPFAEILRSLEDGLAPPTREAVLGPALADIRVLAPAASSPGRPTVIAQGVGEPPGIFDDASGLLRLRLFESILLTVERLARATATVVVIEDLHWADEPSLALLAYLHQNMRQGRVLLILTMRVDEATGHALTFLGDLERDARVSRIDLGGLSLAETQALAAALDHAALDPAAVARIHALSAGNPFMAEELLAAQCGRDGTRSDAREPSVTPRLRDVLRARLARVSADGQRVLRAAATSVRGIDGSSLATVCGMPSDRFEPAIGEVLDGQLLVRAADGAGTRYRFRHEIVRSYVAAHTVATEAERLHRAMAEALGSGVTDGSTGGRIGELAYHWDMAGDLSRGFDAHLAAGLEAEDAFAFEVAGHHFERALESWDRVADAAARGGIDRPRLLLRTAEASASAGHPERAIELAREILDADPDVDPDLSAAVRSRLRWYLWQAGRTSDALEEADRAVRGASRSERWEANGLAHLAGLLLLGGDVAGARRRAGEALVAAGSDRAPDEARLARGILGWCLIDEGSLDEGVETIRGVLRSVSGSASNPFGPALAFGQLATALEAAGRPEEAIGVADEAVAWCERHGVERTFGRGLLAVRARCEHQLGRWDEASTTVSTGFGLGLAGPGTVPLLVDAILLAVTRGDEGGFDDAVRRLAQIPAADRSQDAAGWLAAALAERALWQDDPWLALGWLGLVPNERAGIVGASLSAMPGSTSWRTMDSSTARRLALAARAIADATIRSRASGGESSGLVATLTRSLRARIRAFERPPAVARAWLTDLSCAKAELERARRPGSGPVTTAWSRAGEGGARQGRPAAEAYARWRLAEAIVAARGDRSAAAAELRHGLALASGLGAEPLRHEIAMLARRARLPVDDAIDGPHPQMRPPVPFGLTERELEVLSLLAQGYTNRTIGERLYISPKTASVHVSNILGKMGVAGRVEAAGLAIRLGLAERQT